MDLRGGGKSFQLPLQFIYECNCERIIKIAPHLQKLPGKHRSGAFCGQTVHNCIALKTSELKHLSTQLSVLCHHKKMADPGLRQGDTLKGLASAPWVIWSGQAPAKLKAFQFVLP